MAGGFGDDFLREALQRTKAPLGEFVSSSVNISSPYQGKGGSVDLSNPFGGARTGIDLTNPFGTSNKPGVSLAGGNADPFTAKLTQNWTIGHNQAQQQRAQGLATLAAQRQAQNQPQPGSLATPVPPGGGVEKIEVTNLGPGKRQEFMSRAMALGLAMEKQTGIPAEVFAAIAASESNFGNVRTPALFGIKAMPGQRSETFATPEGSSPGGNRIENHAFKTYNNSYEAFVDFANFLNTQPRYSQAMQALRNGANRDTFVALINQAGYAEDRTWAQRLISPLMNEAQQYRPQAQQITQQAQAQARQFGSMQSGPIQGVSQYDLQLSKSDADAFCGPAAAMMFANRFGRQPTVNEAMNLAAQFGWNSTQGQAGPQAQVRLINALVPESQSYLETYQNQKDKIANEVMAGRPVIISTPSIPGGRPGHYYQITGYNQQTGLFQFGDAVGRNRSGNLGAPLEMIGQWGFNSPSHVIFMRNNAVNQAELAP